MTEQVIKLSPVFGSVEQSVHGQTRDVFWGVRGRIGWLIGEGWTGGVGSSGALTRSVLTEELDA